MTNAGSMIGFIISLLLCAVVVLIGHFAQQIRDILREMNERQKAIDAKINLLNSRSR